MSEVTLFIDTETTGLIDFKKPFDDPSQPRVIQLAAILMDGEKEVGTINSLIYHLGLEIPEEMTKIHGKSTRDCRYYGLTPIAIFTDLKRWIDCSTVIVGHNISFDIGMLRIEYAKLDTYDPFVGKRTFCTKNESTNICKIPNGRGGFKWPRLHEVYKHAFNEDIADRHDAMGDLRATIRVYNWLKQKGK